jgi:hypothetical protein
MTPDRCSPSPSAALPAPASARGPRPRLRGPVRRPGPHYRHRAGPGPRRSSDAPDPVRMRLANGMTVLYVRQAELPVVQATC